MSTTIDIITTAKPTSVNAESPIESPNMTVLENSNPSMLLNLADSPKVRTKLHLYAILLALYVTQYTLSFQAIYFG
jgi:hypothetical protein